MANSGKPVPVVLVTGAARRIGAAIARRLHGDGCMLLLHYHQSAEAMAALCQELDARRPGAVASVQGDLADPDSLPGIVEACIDRFGRLDALVNNASAFFATPLAEATLEAWDALFAVNARAPFFLARAAAPHLRATRGSIVNIADLYALHPRAELCVHAASKAALVSLTQSLALALAPEVRVNAIAPGAIAWPEQAADEARRQCILERTPLARTGRVEEIADAVAWLVAGATFSTGQVLMIDGGRCIAG